MMFRYVIAWVPMVLIAIFNGVLREMGYRKYLGELHAHQVSTLTAILLFGLYVWAIIRFWRPESSGQAIAIGVIWLGLTVAFEFLFGHFVMGHPWSRLLHDYNILAGRLWLLVLAWVTVAPYVFYRLESRL
ncbi:MAG: hypothetical protein ACOYU7_03035 [Bacillota bacterium]